MNKTKKSILSLLLALLLLLSLSACGAAKPAQSAPAAEPTSAPTATPTTAPTSAPTEAPTPEPSPEPAEKNGDIVILYTSDVHCGIDQGFGYAGLQQVRDYLLSEGNEVILVDDGDSIQGEPIGTMTRGEANIELMNQMGYSVAIPGNHEFGYGMEQFLSLAEKAEFPYVSCNFNYKGELVFEPFVIRELAGKRVAFVGVTTPLTPESTTRKSFQDENGEYVYGFCKDETGESLYAAVQSAVDAARAQGADYVIALGHLGDEAECIPFTYGDVIANTSGIDAFLDGHSHDTDQVIVTNKDGKSVPRSACGTKLACIGWCRIGADGKIGTGLYTWTNTVPAPELLGIDNEMSRAVAQAKDALGEKLNEVIASSQVELTISDPVETDTNGLPIRMVRRAETNMGDFCADVFRNQGGADIGIINGGGVRVSLPAGKITLGDILRLQPFGNMLCVLEVSGQNILDALEWSAHEVPNEYGSFLQVSGLSFEIHSYIPSPVIADENSMFAGIEGERRVRNVKVNGEPIDPEGTYTLAGQDYMLLEINDGYTMFKGAPVLQESVKLDNQAVIDYITETLGGVIGEEYADPYGQGRIVIVDTAP